MMCKMFQGKRGLDGHFLSGQLCHHARGVYWWRWCCPFKWAWCMLVSTVSLDRKPILNAAVSLRRWDLPLGVKPAVYLQQWLYGPASITQAFCQCEKASSWTKDWTTVCRQGLLTKTTFQHSAVSPFSLAFCSNIHSSSRSTDRGSCALACHTSLSLPSRGGAGWHWHSPLSQVQAGTTHMPNSARWYTRHSAHKGTSSTLSNHYAMLSFRGWQFITFQQRREIKLVLTSQITNDTLLNKAALVVSW